MQGKAGTEVTLTVVHADATKRETITLQRELIQVETVLGDPATPTTRGSGCSTTSGRSATSA